MKISSIKLIKGLRITIAVAAYFFVAFRLKALGWDGLRIAAIEMFSSGRSIPFIIAVLLMPLGWIVEAQKWRLALNGIESISIVQAIKSVWFGVVAGLLTPNRVGEPLGRMLLISPQNRGRSALLAVWCGFSQQAATLLFGLIGMGIWVSGGGIISFLPVGQYFLYILGCLSVVVSILGLLNLKWISRFAQSLGLLKHALAGESILLEPTVVQTINVLLLSCLRYIVFSTQMLLMFYSFGVEAPIISLYAAIFMIYLFTSFTPTFMLSEAGVRAGFALIIMGSLTANSAAIVSATLLIWILNVALPALIASWFPWFKNA